MILIRTDCYDLAWNLALEYYFSMEKKLGDTVFVLWQADPTVIIGKYQNLRAEVNLEFTAANNIATRKDIRDRRLHILINGNGVLAA